MIRTEPIIDKLSAAIRSSAPATGFDLPAFGFYVLIRNNHLRLMALPTNMKNLETLFEGSLWNSRFVILAAVLGSLFAGFAIFYMATVDVVYLVSHALHYADPDMTEEARKLLHDRTVTHIVEVVDGYLLATVLLIFSLGLYELFISDIDQAKDDKRASSRILVINSLDDLKSRLAKVILMIMIVTLFEEALNMKLTTPIDLLYLGGSIALVALALYLTHGAEHAASLPEHGNEPGDSHENDEQDEEQH